ncbi:MAG: TPM domain-containing protein [Gemmatimonadaceae bacterium]
MIRSALAALLTLVTLQIPAQMPANPAHVARLRWVPNPRVAGGGWVADPSHHLSAGATALVNTEAAALEQETGAEIAVVVIDSTSGLEPFDAALALHRAWGVGKQVNDNGILFLWVPTQRAIQISVGYGLEGVLPDTRVGRIRDTAIFPAFRRDAFDEGVLAGVRALAAAAREETDPRRRIARTLPGTVPQGAASAREEEDDDPVWPFAILGGAVLTAAGVTGGLRYRRYRPRRCRYGHGLLRRIDDAADESYLDEGERLEEQIRSVNYDVWVCDGCDHPLKIPYRAWRTKYTVCPQCSRRTVATSTLTLVSASTSHEGHERVTERCRHCGWEKVYERTVPRISTSSSSSFSSSGSSGGGGGGGGSSFGGGSAGGGGAGGRY